MAGDTAQQIKDKVSIVDVVSQYVKLERSGSSLRARCPFHAEKTASFFVSADRGTYHCFGCGVGGDIFSFVEAIEGLDFKGALKVLAEKAGVEIEYRHGKGKEERDERDRLFELMEAAAIFYSSRLTDEAKNYLKERGLSEATTRAFRIGWASKEWTGCSDYLKSKQFTEKEILDGGLAKKGERGLLTDKFRNRIMFPIADPAGRVVAFSGRIFGEDASPEAPKYLNSPETPLFHKSSILYGMDRAKVAMRKHNFAVLVEGQMDLLASHQAGWTNTVAVSGTAFTPEHASLLRRMTENLVIALDADAAGIKAAGKAARAGLQGGLNVKVARLAGAKDPADLIKEKGKDAWSESIRDAKDIITFLLDVLEEHSKGPDWLGRSVETVVLPYLNDVRSPIAREQYIKEIAKRLGVSAGAVTEALAKVPREPGQAPRQAQAEPPRSDTHHSENRVRQAFSVLLWQRSLKEPTLDVVQFEADLEKVAGKEAVSELKKMPEDAMEELRFSAESLYGTSMNLPREVEPLLQVIHRERLKSELESINMALRKAEIAEDEKEIERLSGVSKVLTTRIAQLHETV
jgi:DNA primase